MIAQTQRSHGPSSSRPPRRKAECDDRGSGRKRGSGQTAAEVLGKAIAPQPSDLTTQPQTTPLATLIAEISALYGQIEEAEEVATSAARSALQFAREMGDRLLQAKAAAGHGNWEAIRQQIKSPRTGKELPSSTATLYQRVAQRWQELEQGQVTTLEEATKRLKSDRQIKSAGPADLPEAATLESGNNSNLPITPEDAAAPPARPATVVATAAKAIASSPVATVPAAPVPGEGMIRASVRAFLELQGGADDAAVSEAAQGVVQLLTNPQPRPVPTYYAPRGVLKLQPCGDGSVEVHGLVLSQQQMARLAALSRQLPGQSLRDAIFSLIDQLPEVDLDA